jgi:hypothetical protein
METPLDKFIDYRGNYELITFTISKQKQTLHKFSETKKHKNSIDNIELKLYIRV